MATTDWHTASTSPPQLAEPAGVPTRVPPTRTGRPDWQHPLADPPTTLAPDRPCRWHQLIPRGVRNLMAEWGWWQNPTPLRPSAHLAQTLAVLERYGWGQSLDFSPTGRMCIRGAQTFLEYTGHVTPAARARAVAYMQQTLQEAGVHEPFFSWNDHTGRTFPQVKHLLTRSITAARKNGE